MTRSIRQGCPLSALLYSLVAEPLGLTVKHEEGIKGIGIEGGQRHIFQYTDDNIMVKISGECGKSNANCTKVL